MDQEAIIKVLISAGFTHLKNLYSYNLLKLLTDLQSTKQVRLTKSNLNFLPFVCSQYKFRKECFKTAVIKSVH